MPGGLQASARRRERGVGGAGAGACPAGAPGWALWRCRSPASCRCAAPPAPLPPRRRCMQRRGARPYGVGVRWAAGQPAPALPHTCAGTHAQARARAHAGPGAHRWIQLHHCRPEPSGPPAKIWKTGIMRPRAPPCGSAGGAGATRARARRAAGTCVCCAAVRSAGAARRRRRPGWRLGKRRAGAARRGPPQSAATRRQATRCPEPPRLPGRHQPPAPLAGVISRPTAPAARQLPRSPPLPARCRCAAPRRGTARPPPPPPTPCTPPPGSRAPGPRSR